MTKRELSASILSEFASLVLCLKTYNTVEKLTTHLILIGIEKDYAKQIAIGCLKIKERGIL